MSFKQLADWLDAQDPKVLAKLRKLDVGEAPKQGWARFTGPHPVERATARRAAGKDDAHKKDTAKGGAKRKALKRVRIRPVAG
ncbi:hypothetical protein GCM10020000_37530 [Streptomyces olivoverticillatus]